MPLIEKNLSQEAMVRLVSIISFLIYMAVSCNARACENSYPSGPEGVVRAFAKEDFTRGNNYWKRVSQYTTWLDAPGWDDLILVSGYEVKGAVISGVDADVAVTYKDSAEYSFDDKGPVFKPLAREQNISFHLVLANGRWKISAPQNPPHLNFKYIVDDLTASSGQQAASFRQKQVLKQLKEFYLK